MFLFYLKQLLFSAPHLNLITLLNITLCWTGRTAWCVRTTCQRLIGSSASGPPPTSAHLRTHKCLQRVYRERDMKKMTQLSTASSSQCDLCLILLFDKSTQYLSRDQAIVSIPPCLSKSTLSLTPLQVLNSQFDFSKKIATYNTGRFFYWSAQKTLRKLWHLELFRWD